MIDHRKYENPQIPAEIDNENYHHIRNNVNKFYQFIKQNYLKSNYIVLDIAPEMHGGFKDFLIESATLETLDIDPSSNSTYILDLCNRESAFPEGKYDIVICTEVLEHTANPFYAVESINKMLKPGGIVCLSTPFNFRIHGPLPDNWRFTEHGIKQLLSEFSIEHLEALNTEGRPLMPIQYTAIAKRITK